MSEKPVCSRCKEAEALPNYSYCRECRKEYSREYAKKAKEKKRRAEELAAQAPVDCEGVTRVLLTCPCCQRKLRVRVTSR